MKTLVVCIKSKNEEVLKDLRLQICMLLAVRTRTGDSESSFSTTMLDGEVLGFKVKKKNKVSNIS